MTDDRGQKTEVGNLPSSVIRRPSSEADQRAVVVAEARSWIGTPYHNCADLKGVGVDCGMLLVRVFVDAGLCAPFDPRPYPIDWHLHKGDERYLGFIFDRGSEVSEPQPGDVMVLRYGRSYAHGGIVTKPRPTTFVHAFHPARRVLEEEIAHNSVLSDTRRAPRFFSYWAKSGTRASGLKQGVHARERPIAGASAGAAK
jgi:cell wall-associated NlpC family hydrolase